MKSELFKSKNLENLFSIVLIGLAYRQRIGPVFFPIVESLGFIIG